MAFEAELSYRGPLQHFRIARPMRDVAGRTALEFRRSMFEYERPLLVRVTFDARDVGTDRELRLFRLKPAVGVVTVAALHHAFQHLVMEWLRELRLLFAVAA